MFDQTALKSSHKRSLSLLYSHKLAICPNCGLRLSNQHLSKHMDWHFKQETKKRERANQTRCRVWYLNLNDWVCDADLTDKAVTPFAVPEETEDVIHSVPADDSQPKCSVCQEEFQRVWDNLADEWVLKDCIYSSGASDKKRSGDVILHMNCYNDRLTKENKSNELGGIHRQLEYYPPDPEPELTPVIELGDSSSSSEGEDEPAKVVIDIEGVDLTIDRDTQLMPPPAALKGNLKRNARDGGALNRPGDGEADISSELLQQANAVVEDGRIDLTAIDKEVVDLDAKSSEQNEGEPCEESSSEEEDSSDGIDVILYNTPAPIFQSNAQQHPAL